MAHQPAIRRGWLRPGTAAIGAAVVSLLASTVAVSPAQSAADVSCPEAFPVAAVTKGMPVHGLTVTSGTTPDTFDGSVLGVLNDGIAPGLDMIMVKLSGSEITDAGGDVDKEFGPACQAHPSTRRTVSCWARSRTGCHGPPAT